MEKKKNDTIIHVEDLTVNIKMDEGTLTAVRGVNFTIERGKTLGLVGESGCGKSLTSKSILGINDKKCQVGGHIWYSQHGEEPTDLLALKPTGKEIRAIRGKQISMIFQEPMVAFSPMYTIGNQINECTRLHITKDKEESKKITLEMMKKVGIANAEKRYNQYPHEFSGGMRQRVVIAIAIACNPQILICDEPTTALDVTIQAQILSLLKDLREKYRLSIIMITHDLGVVANIADRIAVMYAGDIIEIGTSEDIFYDPRHPYTWALLSSLPQIGVKGEELFSIQGTPPNLFMEIRGDAFAARNPQALKIDFVKRPPYFQISETHRAKTWLLDPRAPKVAPPPVVEKIRNGGIR